MKTKMNFGLTILSIYLLLFSYTSAAGQANVPNAFVSGTPANAAEVNENFNALQSAINDNDVRIIEAAKRLVAVDANGNVLGSVFGGNNQVISILTTQGYAAEVFARSAYIAAGDSLGSYSIAFTDADCGASGGQGYVGFDGNVPSPQSGQPYFPGTVIVASNDVTQPQPLFYLPKPGTVVGDITVQSVYAGPQNGCQSGAFLLQDSVEILPNDPVITGFPNTPIPAPITIEYR